MTWLETASATAVPLLTMFLILVGVAKWYVQAAVKISYLEADAAVRKEVLDSAIIEIERIVRVEILKINGYYIRAMGSDITGAELQRILAEVKTELATLRNTVDGVKAFGQISKQRIDGLHEDVVRLQNVNSCTLS